MKNFDSISIWFLSMILFAVVNSCVVAGFLKSLKDLFGKINKENEKKSLPNFVGIILTFLMGFFFIFYFETDGIFQFIINGFFVGCLSVFVYESAIRSLKEFIPTIFEVLTGILKKTANK